MFAVRFLRIVAVCAIGVARWRYESLTRAEIPKKRPVGVSPSLIWRKGSQYAFLGVRPAIRAKATASRGFDVGTKSCPAAQRPRVV